ncbi:alpha-ketoglutarate decarboxylase [Aequorivita sp. F47161]|uniref:Alpha-ketoglutarate decarboxylase n=1 Tax=Aequorivita vitellina TaxID=2874475 RepID=A0A9X1QRK9_9FLAO|nr:alpha-ketoglutarate decarboxylase [Aequorivita vitellina]MCG2417683.1 alpha-ketoglutarate decarboxylase [Aequorivita vitellina]MCZ4317898.1 alpha-ketoglutarate decarboxylase [Aequorivita viscosa]
MKKTEFRYVNKLFCTLLFLFCITAVFSQKNKNEFWQHVRFGGGFGLSFGDGFFSGTIAPSAIYQFNDQFAAGVAFNGTYASLKNDTNATILGGSVLALYNVVPEIQLSAEFEELHVSRKYKYLGSPDVMRNYWYPALFFGVGFRSNNFTVGIRYDVLYDADESIYANAFAPFVRMYF